MDALPADLAAWLPDPVPAEPASAGRSLAGVSCPVLTAAARRIQTQWAAEGGSAQELEERARILAGVVLAVACRTPEYATDLTPRPAPDVMGAALDRLSGELIRGWDVGVPPSPARRVLDHLVAVERVRQALVADPSWNVGAHLGSDGLDILTGVVHDLRSPLTSILFLAETLQQQRSGPVNELQHRQLGLVYSAALGLSVVVSDALELARDGQLVEREPSTLSISEILHNVRDVVRPMAEEKGLSIHIVTPAQDRRIGHPMALSRVLLNLTTNALKFTHEGHVKIIAVATSETGIEFAVRDTGPGIEPQGLGHLYEPFHRSVERAGWRFSSTGLGLAMTRRLVEAMGSELHLQTRAGWGTRFFFELELPPARLY